MATLENTGGLIWKSLDHGLTWSAELTDAVFLARSGNNIQSLAVTDIGRVYMGSGGGGLQVFTVGASSTVAVRARYSSTLRLEAKYG